MTADLAALPSLGPVPARVVGIDIADSILRTAAAAAGQAGVEAELLRANLEALPFADGHFDVVLCTQAIEHVLDVPLALSELHRVLQPRWHARDLHRQLGGAGLTGAGCAAGRCRPTPRAAGPASQGGLPTQLLRERRVRGASARGGLQVRRTETFRFHCTGAPRAVQHALNKLDEKLPEHAFGDILLVEARP